MKKKMISLAAILVLSTMLFVACTGTDNNDGNLTPSPSTATLLPEITPTMAPTMVPTVVPTVSPSVNPTHNGVDNGANNGTNTVTTSPSIRPTGTK